MLGAFPSFLGPVVASAISVLPAPLHPPSEGDVGPVSVSGEVIRIPHRIYNPVLSDPLRRSLSSSERSIIDWLYTRHHDGLVREASLRSAVPVREEWMAPFAVQLIGEYVVEILVVLEELLTDEQTRVMQGWAAVNPDFMDLTRARVASYWNCHYRTRFPRLDEYVGSRLLHQIGAGGSLAGSSA